MDLLSSIRKSGSRGGVNFSWDDVQTSQHRENYLGHSMKAPVGRWQKGRDLNWYAKGDDKVTVEGETAEETKARERKEEIRRIKEAEEDAIARAMGLPVPDRGATGANAITVREVNRAVKEAGVGEEGQEEMSKRFGDFVGKLGDQVTTEAEPGEGEKGGLLGDGNSRVHEEYESRRKGRDKASRREERGSRKEERRRSRSPVRKPERHRYRERSRDSRRQRSGSRESRRRSRSRDHRRHRSRSGDREFRRIRVEKERDDRRHRDRSGDERRRRYRSRTPEGRRHRQEGIDRRRSPRMSDSLEHSEQRRGRRR